MATPACPHCRQPLKVTPVFRWGSRFQCPHCRRVLRFATATNALGFAGSFFFFAMMWAVMADGSSENRWIAAGCAALWVVLVALSHAMRSIEKGD